uniref:Uncharacterized protein n=1 Tax=Micrurus carvalhoi TaxID=3147026 RepID=A0A2H6NG63_9SAUR
MHLVKPKCPAIDAKCCKILLKLFVIIFHSGRMRCKETSWQISWSLRMAFCQLHWSFIDARFSFAICTQQNLIGSQSLPHSLEENGTMRTVFCLAYYWDFPPAKRLIKIRPSLYIYIHVALKDLESSLRLKPCWG